MTPLHCLRRPSHCIPSCCTRSMPLMSSLTRQSSKLIFGGRKQLKGEETNDDADGFRKRYRRGPRGGRDHVHTPIAQKPGADPTWRRQEAAPVGAWRQREVTVGHCVCFRFGNVAPLLSGVISTVAAEVAPSCQRSLTMLVRVHANCAHSPRLDGGAERTPKPGSPSGTGVTAR
jgi:hypothetical protein